MISYAYIVDMTHSHHYVTVTSLLRNRDSATQCILMSYGYRVRYMQPTVDMTHSYHYVMITSLLRNHFIVTSS